MLKSPFIPSIIFCLFLFASFSALGQNEEAKAKSLTNADETVSVQKKESGSQELPAVLGGGEAPANSLMISSPGWRGGKEITPEALGVDNLLPARWLDKEHFLFIGTDAVDIQAYFVYFSKNDQIYECAFEVGEQLGYGQFEESVVFEFTIEDDKITAFQLK